MLLILLSLPTHTRTHTRRKECLHVVADQCNKMNEEEKEELFDINALVYVMEAKKEGGKQKNIK